jgi:hypothetical protein
MDKILNEEQKRKVAKEEEDFRKKQRKDKINSYSKYVKEIHWPEISSQKMRELEDLRLKKEH